MGSLTHFAHSHVGQLKFIYEFVFTLLTRLPGTIDLVVVTINTPSFDSGSNAVKSYMATHFPWLMTEEIASSSEEDDAAKKAFCRENPEICRQLEKMSGVGGGGEGGGRGGGAKEIGGDRERVMRHHEPWGQWETFKVKRERRGITEYKIQHVVYIITQASRRAHCCPVEGKKYHC